MNVSTLSKKSVIALTLVIVVSMMLVQPWSCDAFTPGPTTDLKSSVKPMAMSLSTQVSDVVVEWNQQAVALALLPASGLLPIQQTRVMAIFQAAVHDAVN